MSKWPEPGDRIVDLDGEAGKLLAIDGDLDDYGTINSGLFEPAIIFVVERDDFSVDEIIHYRSDGSLPIRQLNEKSD